MCLSTLPCKPSARPAMLESASSSPSAAAPRPDLPRLVARDSRTAHPCRAHHVRRQRDDPDLGQSDQGEEDDRSRSRECCRASSSTILLLTISMPAELTAASGMNALAPCGGIALRTGQPLRSRSMVAEEAIRALANGLPRAVRPAG